MTQPQTPRQDSSLRYVLLGAAVYILGFVFLAFVGQNYTGVMSFLAPATILTGALIIVVGLLF